MRWIGSWSLSSGAHSRDPLARNDGGGGYPAPISSRGSPLAPTVIARSAATKQSTLSFLRRDGLLRYARNDGRVERGLTPASRRGPSIRDLPLRSGPVSSPDSLPGSASLV